MAVPSVTSVCSGRSQRSGGQTERDLAISRNTESKLALPTHSKAAGGGTGPVEKQLKDFWLRHLFQYQKEDQFILTASEFQQTDLWEFLTWESQGYTGAHVRDVRHPAQFSFCFFRNEKEVLKTLKS